MHFKINFTETLVRCFNDVPINIICCQDATILEAKICLKNSLAMKISPLDHQCRTCITNLTRRARKRDFEYLRKY